MTLNEGAGVVDFNRTKGRWCIALIQDVNHQCGPTAQHRLKFFFEFNWHGDAANWLDVGPIFLGGSSKLWKQWENSQGNGSNFSSQLPLDVNLIS